MSALRTQKIFSAVLILFTGAVLLHLSSTLRKLDVDIVYKDTTTRDRNRGPSPSITRSPYLPEQALEKGSVPKSKTSHGQELLIPSITNDSVLPHDIPRPKTILDPNVKYLSYMAYAGLTNQFIALENAAYVAFRLNRTLIIPPITTNSHDQYNSNQRWSEFLDLPRFTFLSGIRVVEWNDVRPLTPEQVAVGRNQARMGKKSFPLWETLAENLTCQVIYGYGIHEQLHSTELTFSRQFLFRPKFELPPPRKPKTPVYDRTKFAKDNMNMEDVVVMDDLLDRYEGNQDQLLFLSHAFKIKEPAGSMSWNAAGQHFHFVPKVLDYVQRLIQHRAPETKETGKYIAIHVRRGDIWLKCRSLKPEQMMACITPLGHYAEAVEQATKSLGMRLPVIVATDSKSEEDHTTIARLGWRRLNHDLYTTEEELGIFGPALVDAAILANAEVMVGSSSSTMSRVAAWRQRSWHKRTVLYPRTTSSWTPPL
ncbi:GDP-fucose protein O-fucosyltransferase-domain-containing protein [Dissophora ornata]|nr:hypothetical protein BGZ58_001609 [Dissophora ornata]KAI8601873.1 GDP-fucose protein O-fucosyltransferase-domain-containing protein [Dissophora ornata]